MIGKLQRLTETRQNYEILSPKSLQAKYLFPWDGAGRFINLYHKIIIVMAIMQSTEINRTVIKIPEWIILCQCISFAVLYAIWAQPETILIRHVCLIFGAIFGVYEIYKCRHFLLTKEALPIWLIIALFLWMTFHLFFLRQDYALQIIEYHGIWKRTIIGFIFALGLGLALSNQTKQSFWWIIFIGLMIPTLLYLVKYCLTFSGVLHPSIVPDWLKLFSSSAPFYVPKTTYVVFCLPLLSVSIAMIKKNILLKKWIRFDNFIYIFSAALVVLVFYLEKILNGTAWSLILALILMIEMFRKWLSNTTSHKKFIVLFLMAILTTSGGAYLLKSHSIRQSTMNFYADLKVFSNPIQYRQWENQNGAIPINENGVPVNIKYYARLSWAYNGLRMVPHYYLGYGLIERSFGHIGKIEWPNSDLSQSHSGWLDLTLGIGIPGVTLVLLAVYLAINQVKTQKTSWSTFGFYYLLAYILLWVTTEVSQRVYFDSFIFSIALVAGLSLNHNQGSKSNHI